MKQSKKPLWKKSMLQLLNYESICEMLWEIAENGDMFGYDIDEKGYYNEYKDQFDDLSALAYDLIEHMEETDISENWDDMTVSLLGNVYAVLGFDVEEMDYYNLLNTFEEDLAQTEAAKRILRLTKTQMLALFRKVMVALLLFYDIKAAHDCLTSIVEELDERAAIMQVKTDQIDRLYEDLTGQNAEEFDQLVENLPQRMWVE